MSKEELKRQQTVKEMIDDGIFQPFEGSEPMPDSHHPIEPMFASREKFKEYLEQQKEVKDETKKD